MCDPCVIENVKERLLSRRDFFRTGLAATATAALAGAGTAALTSAAPAAAAALNGEVADLSHTLDETFPTFSGKPHYSSEQLFNYAEHKVNTLVLHINEHTGTHMDAPLHFSANGWSVEEIPPSQLIAPLCIIDIKARAAQNADAEVTPDDIKKWIAAHGDIPDGACVAMNSGWDRHVHSAKFRNADADGRMHFPGFHAEAALMLLETRAVALAVDTLSIDYGRSTDFPVHYSWLPQNRWGLECVANLDALPATGATLIAGVPKYKGGTGGPTRILAVI